MTKKILLRKSSDLPCEEAIFTDMGIILDSGYELNDFRISFKSYGTLNNEKSNAILICHALTADQFVTNNNPITGKEGWWSNMVGPGKPIDTNKFYVICSNVLGGCIGSTGPKEIKSDTKSPYGIKFPTITIKDMVKVQKILIDEIKIDKLYAVIGASMGAMQVLQWTIDFPDKIINAIHIAGALKHSAQNIAFHEVGRQAIMNDNSWSKGNYYADNIKPERGLSVARMIAHITY